MAILGKSGDRLTREEDHEVLWIEAWGPDALRVRATKGPAMPEEDWALIPRPARARIEIADGRAEDAALIWFCEAAEAIVSSGVEQILKTCNVP